MSLNTYFFGQDRVTIECRHEYQIKCSYVTWQTYIIANIQDSQKYTLKCRFLMLFVWDRLGRSVKAGQDFLRIPLFIKV